MSADEDVLRMAYSRFERNHDALREDLLARLPAAPDSHVVRRYRRIAWRSAPTPIRWAAGLAAAASVALAIGLLVFRSATPAYALADLPIRLAKCRSISVDGWVAVNGTRLPYHFYVEEPSFYWHTTYSITNDQASLGYSASDGKRYIVVSEGDRTAVTGKEVPLAAELMAHLLQQGVLPAQHIGRNRLGYKNTGSEIVRGLHTDVYQLRSDDGLRRVLWVDSATGLPIQATRYERVQGVEQQVMAVSIRPNAARPANLPTFEPPAGYVTTHRDHTPYTSIGVGAGSVGDETLDLRVALNIADRAILVCWIRYSSMDGTTHEPDLGGPVGRPDALRVEAVEGQHRYRAYHLRDNLWDNGLHARWSLLVSDDPQARIGDACAILETPRGKIEIEFSPLRFENGRLAQVIEDVQRLTLPPDAARDRVLSVEQLLELARGAHRGE